MLARAEWRLSGSLRARGFCRCRWFGDVVFVTGRDLLTVFAQGLLLINFSVEPCSAARSVGVHPWRATTLDERSLLFAAASGMILAHATRCYRGAYDFSLPGVAEDFVPQTHSAGAGGNSARHPWK